MKSHVNAQFRQMFRDLPPEVREQARTAYRLFQQNPYHPGLHFKSIHAVKPIYSARINRTYRVVGVRQRDEIVWFWIGPHSEYDNLISQL